MCYILSRLLFINLKHEDSENRKSRRKYIQNNMKKIISILSLAFIVCVALSFTTTLKTKNSNVPEELCYDFFVKCKGSNQFVETVKAKSLPVAKSMLVNRYPQCTVQPKSTNGHKCN